MGNILLHAHAAGVLGGDAQIRGQSEAHARAGGDAVPSSGVAAGCEDLEALFGAHKVERLVVAGDFLEDGRHGAGRQPDAGVISG